MFGSLRNKLAEEAKKSGELEVANLKEALVDVRTSSSKKNNVVPPTQKTMGKESKKLKVELLGPCSSCGRKRMKFRLPKKPETSIHRDIEKKLDGI